MRSCNRPRTYPRRAPELCLLAVLWLLAGRADGVDNLRLSLGEIAAAGWHAAGVVLELDLTGKSPAGTVTVDRLTLGGELGGIRDVEVHCPAVRLTEDAVACPNGRLRSIAPALADTSIPLSFRLALDGSAATVTVPSMQMTYNAPDGSLAAQDLYLGLDAEVHARGEEWGFRLGIEAHGGQAYIDPVFADFDAHPARLQARGELAGDRVRIEQLHVDQPGVLQVAGHAAFDTRTWTLGSLDLRIADARLPIAYKRYLQPFLIGMPLAKLATSGRVQGRLAADARGPTHAAIRAQNLAVEDEQGRFRLRGIEADVNWRRDAALADTPVSNLRWTDARFHGVDAGGAALAFRAAGDALRLSAPARIPLLDGALAVDAFSAEHLRAEQPSLSLDAKLEPIRLDALGRALGWPTFGGTLAGAIPQLAYRDGRIQLGGDLTAEVFDGRLRIGNFRIERPFSARPRMRLDAHARGLALEMITQAFSFGRIQGRLDADVTGLRTIGWVPVAFDAWLRTPAEDDSRRRISQKAIDDIASLGGTSGVVSRGFLRFFDEFAYDRIGLGCRLADNVCHMCGLDPAEDGGYVIVRGSWLPRVDVIGHTREVSWPVLIEQLKSVTASEGPVVQ